MHLPRGEAGEKKESTPFLINMSRARDLNNELNSLRIVIHASLLAYYSFVRSYSSVTEY